MFITLTSIQNPRKPRAMRVRADQIQSFYRFDYISVGEGTKTHTEVEILGRAANLQVEETVEQIEALLKPARPDLIDEVHALRLDVTRQHRMTHGGGPALRAEPVDTTSHEIARLLVAVWNTEMSGHLSVVEVARWMKLTPGALSNIYARALELAK